MKQKHQLNLWQTNDDNNIVLLIIFMFFVVFFARLPCEIREIQSSTEPVWAKDTANKRYLRQNRRSSHIYINEQPIGPLRFFRCFGSANSYHPNKEHDNNSSIDCVAIFKKTRLCVFQRGRDSDCVTSAQKWKDVPPGWWYQREWLTAKDAILISSQRIDC